MFSSLQSWTSKLPRHFKVYSQWTFLTTEPLFYVIYCVFMCFWLLLYYVKCLYLVLFMHVLCQKWRNKTVIYIYIYIYRRGWGDRICALMFGIVVSNRIMKMDSFYTNKYEAIPVYDRPLSQCVLKDWQVRIRIFSYVFMDLLIVAFNHFICLYWQWFVLTYYVWLRCMHRA